MPLTSSMEDYLEAVLIVAKKQIEVRSVDIGQETAKKIYERHCFFTEQLIAAGIDPKTAEADACRIEHNISDESFSRLKETATQKQD